jgi:hypothetical protein
MQLVFEWNERKGNREILVEVQGKKKKDKAIPVRDNGGLYCCET